MDSQAGIRSKLQNGKVVARLGSDRQAPGPASDATCCLHRPSAAFKTDDQRAAPTGDRPWTPGTDGTHVQVDQTLTTLATTDLGAWTLDHRGHSSLLARALEPALDSQRSQGLTRQRNKVEGRERRR